jgi:hypothetical protein
MATPKKTKEVVTLTASDLPSEVVAELKAKQDSAIALATPSKLEQARNNAVDVLAGGYGATKEYALILNEVFPQRENEVILHWFDVEQNYKDDFSLAVNAEKKMFYSALRAKVTGEKEINPSSYWSRIKNYGKVARLGEVKPEVLEVLEDGTEVVNEGASGDGNRSPNLRYVEELSRLWKFGERQESLPENLIEAHKLVGDALTSLGIKLNMLTD